MCCFLWIPRALGFVDSVMFVGLLGLLVCCACWVCCFDLGLLGCFGWAVGFVGSAGFGRSAGDGCVC